MDTEQRTQQQIARLTLAADLAFVRAALALVREACAGLGLHRDDISPLERAIEEVCVNVIHYAFEPGQRATFDIALQRQPGQLVIAVEDQGLPFDFTRLEDGTSSALTSPALHAAADAVHFSSLGRRGNRVEIVKRLPYPHIEASIDPAQRAPADAPPPPLDIPITIRVMTPDDAIAVARCTYHCYGYTIPDEYLYYPDRLRQMLDGGLLEICVAVTGEGEIVGFLTVELDHAGAALANLGEAMVDPRFRGHGLFEKMKTFAKQRAAAKGLLGLSSESVTVHPYSQKGCIALGASETGVQLGDEVPAVDFKQIGGGVSKKRTATVLYYLRTGQEPPRVIYAPSRHQAMIGRIYEHGGFRRTLQTAPVVGAPTLAPGAQLKVQVFPEWSEASLLVTRYGSDLAELVRFRLRELCLSRIDWIGLDLPLGDPGAQSLCASLEGLGFFFAGVIPELADGDVLRLQYLNEVDADVESAQIASDFGKELFAYVVRAMG